MAGVDRIYLSTTIILCTKSNKVVGSATGFFYEDEEKRTYLVTNKHVIYGEEYANNPNPQVDAFKLNLHIDATNLANNEQLEVPLFKNGEKLWLEHSNSKVDVILVPLEIDKKFLISPVHKSLIEIEEIIINFEKIFVMGYPYGWYDKFNNLPITRIGHLSSPFKVPFMEQPFMLGDVETHNGMSGGPVFMLVNDYVVKRGNQRIKFMGSAKLIFIGIHSGKPKWDIVDDKGQIRQIPHKLTIIWLPELIFEILGRK